MSNIYWLNEDSRKFLEKGYLLEGETPEQRIRDIAEAAEKILGIEGFADKFERYMHLGFYSLASPIWSNFGRERGLPISCFGSYVPDTMAGIVGKASEVAMMTKHGGGTSAYFGALRGRGSEIGSGGESTGSVHFMELSDRMNAVAGYPISMLDHSLELFDRMMGVVSQGNVRRGSFAAYLPIDHTDIYEFLKIREEDSEIQDVSIGVTVDDAFIDRLKNKDKKAAKVWAAVIQKRFETGYPYIFFTDNVNNQAPEIYKRKGLRINNSNLCTEIMLSNSEDESFVCDLMSVNLEKFDEIELTDAIETAIYFLDATMQEFINKTEGIPFMEAPRKFAINQRALGLGVLGWHSLLQSKMIPFESMEAKLLNKHIFRTLRKKADKATEDLANMFGRAPIYEGTEWNRRNTTTIAIAPTTSSSFILGQVSPSIEPLNSNYFVKNLAKGNFTYKNPALVKMLEEKGKNTPEVWKSILVKGGSSQHLDFLSDLEKAVTKTFGEISQKEIIIQASQRHPDVDQGQSVNLMIGPNVPMKEVSQLLLFAHEQGIKSLYYQRSANPAQELARSILTCSSCEA